MAFRAASAPAGGASGTVLTLTMPTGTVASDHVLVALAVPTATAISYLLSSSAAGFSYGPVVDYRPAAGMSWQLWEATGLAAGDTVTLTGSISSARYAIAYVFSNDIGAVGAVYTRPSSLSTTAAPGRSINAGAKMLVFSTERTTTTGTAVSGAAVSTGETVTQLSYQEGTGFGDASFYLGEYTATANPPGTATVTYSGPGTDGASVQIVEVAGTEAVPSVTAAFGGAGQFSAAASVPSAPAQFKSAGPIVASTDMIDVAVPAGTVVSDVVYVWTAWGNSGVKKVQITQPAAKLGGVSPVIPSRHDANVGWNIQAFTGLVAGDVIRVEITNGTGNNAVKLFVFDNRLSPPGPVGSRAGSTTVTTVPSIAFGFNTPVYLFAVERTTAAGSQVVNAVNDSGFTVTQRSFEETVGDPDITFYLGQLSPSTTSASGATALVYTTATTDAAGVAIPAVGVPATCAPVFGNRAGYFSIRVRSQVDGLLRTNLGRPSEDTIRVKTWTQGAGNVRLAVSTTGGMASPVYSSAVTPDADGYAALSVSGLSADTAYWYQIEFAGTLTGTVNPTRTWPTAGQPAACVAIIAAACTAGFGSMNGPSNPTTFNNMRSHTDAKGNVARLWVDLGDEFYPHTTTSPQGWPVPESEQVIRAYWESQHGQPNRTAFHKVIPTAHTYSDNDFLGSNSDSTIAPATVTVVNRVRRQVLSDGPFGSVDGKGLYWSALLGRTLIIQTDSRTYSGNNLLPLSDTAKSMLGTVQKQWLLDQFARTDYTAVLWCHDNQWVGNPALSTKRPALDNWQAYPVERQEIADFITVNRVPLLAYVHADNHTLAYDDGTNNAYGNFPYTMTGPVYQAAQTWPDLVTGGNWPTAAAGQNPANYYTWIEITDDGQSISAHFQGIDATSGLDLVKIDNYSTMPSQRAATRLKHEFYANVNLDDITPQPAQGGGITGPQGQQGVSGPPGPPGPAGTSGTKWWNGAGPPTPPPSGSVPGDYYLNTTNGDIWVL